MSHAKRALWVAAAAALFAVGTACSMSSERTSLSGGTSNTPGEPSNEPGQRGDETGGSAPGAATASGVVLVHAAAFPSFRLCFENSPNLLPQPDSKVMPAANVVGVEVGSVVRIDPLTAPGKVYVINERSVRSIAGDPTGVPCGELLGTGSRSLVANNDYHVAAVIDKPLGLDAPLGQGRVQVLAITGCGSQAFLDHVKASNTTCGDGWSSTSGNLVANVLDLPTSAQAATSSSIPVQLVHLAPALQAQLGTAKLEVSFGDLATPGKLPTTIASGTGLLATSAQVTLNVDQNEQSMYGTHGFRIEAREQNDTVKFSFDLSLAAVQDLSSPSDVPTSYYHVASNYALLLLGDPAVLVDGGAANADRRRVQLLAVPVLDPATIDAGSDASSAGDGGT